MNENEGLRKFLATIRGTESRDYGTTGDVEEGVTPFGAYGMLVENWDSWSAAAGVGGHNKYDSDAQDYVAAYWATKLFQRYGDWDMVAMAWFAGVEQTDRAVQSGEGTGWFKHTRNQDFFARYKVNEEKAEQVWEPLPKMAGAWINPQGAPKGWLMPIAGPSEYSNSFFVSRKITSYNKTGIHGAIDVYAKRGTPIVAPVGGKVLSAKKSSIGGYTVRMRGSDGLTYYFAHMDSQAVVKPGQTVQPGAHLGFVGSSGNAQGTTPHLHFSIRRGSTRVNPYSYLQGSKNAGNYYSPEGMATEEVGTETTADKYNGLLNSVSNRVAGGERRDYRRINLDGTDVEATVETGLTSEERTAGRQERI